MSLQKEDKEKLLKHIRLVGEGKGRLTFNQRKYVFNIESLLNEKSDWILAVSIPFQGEESMILPDLKRKEASIWDIQSFEERLNKEFYQKKIIHFVSPREMMQELRSVIRFVLSPNWGLKRVCSAQNKKLLCVLDNDTFEITATNHELYIKKMLNHQASIQIIGRNFKNSFFRQTEIRLIQIKKQDSMDEVPFSMEFFWN